MTNLKYLNIDGLLLQTFATVYEERSVTQAAQRLNINQSTISHRLDRIRSLVGDPLFVRAGRRMVTTPRADDMVIHVQNAIASLQSIFEETSFDPSTLDEHIVIATTDYERINFLFDAYKLILEEAPNLKIDFVWDQYDNRAVLRDGNCDMVVSMFDCPPEQDIRQRILFQESLACFYDPAVVDPIETGEAYASAKHVSVLFAHSDISIFDNILQRQGIKRNIVVTVPSLSELPQLMKGSDLIATLPQGLSRTVMKGATCSPIPFDFSDLTCRLFWHDRTHNSPKHAWIRSRLIEYITRKSAAAA